MNWDFVPRREARDNVFAIAMEVTKRLKGENKLIEILGVMELMVALIESMDGGKDD